MGRGDTSDAQWALIEPLLPRQKRGGKWNDHRRMFDGILWVLRTGAPWRDLPERYGKWQSVYDRFNRWKKDGTLDKILKACASAWTRTATSTGTCGAWTAAMSGPPAPRPGPQKKQRRAH